MRGFFNFIFSKIFLCLLFIAVYIAGIILLCLCLPAFLSLGAAALSAFIFTAAAAVKAASGGYPAEFRCAWLLAIAALPVIGAAAYFITLYKPRPCENTLEYGGTTGCTECAYFDDGGDFFAAVCRAADGARKKIYLQFYIISGGEVFSSLCAKLEGALARGVDVRIMTDALGSALHMPKRQLKQLKKMGARVKIFNRLVPPPLSRLNFRDHRKIAVFDGDIAFSGGMNLADEYAGITAPHGHWKDSAFMVRGNAAAFFEALFLSAWSGCSALALPPPAEGESPFTPVFDCPPAQSGGASRALVRAISCAKERVWALTPYLCPDERVFSALVGAAERGVEVAIIVPAVPDKKSAYAVTCDCAARLEERGVEVYAYTPGFMHAKAVICDGECFLGSYNLDCRSLWLNYECGAFFSGDIARAAAEDFEKCRALSAPHAGRKRKAARLLSPLA